MTYDEMPSFMADLRVDDTVFGRALEFMILTTARRGEALGATSDEVDLDAAVWRIGSERRKTGVGREIPLCTRAVEILRDRVVVAVSPAFFADARGMAPDERLLDRPLRRLGRKGVTSHSFRSMFLDWAKRDGTPKDAVLAALGYPGEDGAELLRRQRELMKRWASFCLSGRDASLAPAGPA